MFGQMRSSALVLAGCAMLVACAPGGVVTTEDASVTPSSTTAAPSPSPRLRNDQLARAFDFAAARPDGRTAYYFASPSERWMCAIIPRERAGCQSSTGSDIPITGVPDSVPDAQGEASAPNAIQVDNDTEAQFAVLDPPGYALDPGPAAILGFDKVLSVAGFQCNVQEATGISCLSELTGKGFTFSADGYTLQYTALPA